MKMSILITETQQRMILTESIGRELGEILKKNSDIGKIITTQIKDIIGTDKVGLLTFGASIGGFIGPVNDFLQGKYPTLNDGEISLILTGVIATFFYSSPKLIKRIKDKIKNDGLETEYETALTKSKELLDTFFDFMDSINITLFKVTNVLGFAFLLPLLPYIHEMSSGHLTASDINKITKLLISYGVITISSATLKEILTKLIKRFRG
jgi:hypothetical protein